MGDDYRRPAGLPEFDRPPVTETVLGVDFAPVPGWNVTHYGLLHRDLLERYPRVEVQPPLPQQTETFDGRNQAGPFEILIGQAVDTRCWFIDPSDSKLLQVQSDRFLRNWRKREGHDYPRYPAIRKAFAEDWDVYVGFLDEVGLQRPSVRQCELTYINHIEQPASSLPNVLSFWRSPDEPSFLPPPERGGFSVSYRMAKEPSRLHVALQPAVRISDGKEILQLTLTVRGAMKSVVMEEFLGWFDRAHEWIVRGFVELTSTRMQREWGKRETR